VKYLNAGQVLNPGQTLMLKKLGSCRGPNGTYEIFSDAKGQMVVRSELSQRKFLLTWQNVVEIAVDNGIDDKVLNELAVQ
jgi:hypothetical protein